MKRKIDTIAIENAGSYIQEQYELLKSSKEKLVKDIERINEAYKGTDANLIIKKYKRRAQNLNSIITNFEYYAVYLQKLAGSYRGNLERATRKLSYATDIQSSESLPLETESFNLEKMFNASSKLLDKKDFNK